MQVDQVSSTKWPARLSCAYHKGLGRDLWGSSSVAIASFARVLGALQSLCVFDVILLLLLLLLLSFCLVFNPFCCFCQTNFKPIFPLQFPVSIVMQRYFHFHFQQKFEGTLVLNRLLRIATELGFNFSNNFVTISFNCN